MIRVEIQLFLKPFFAVSEIKVCHFRKLKCWIFACIRSYNGTKASFNPIYGNSIRWLISLENKLILCESILNQNCNSASSMNDNQKAFADDEKNDGKHNISPLHIPVIPTFVADLTPTPTRFLRSFEEAGLFNEICKTSYTQDFKRQNSSEETAEAANSTNLISSAQQQAPIPSVILESIADEAEDEVSTATSHDRNPSNFVASLANESSSQLMYNTPQEADIPAEAAVVEQSAERPIVQVLLQLPNGSLIPIHIPADALAHATIPVTTSPAIGVTSSVPLVTPVVVAPQASSGITSSTKQKLKAALQQNIQQSQQLHQQPLKPQQQQLQPRYQQQLQQRQTPSLAVAAINQVMKTSMSDAGPIVSKTRKVPLTSDTSYATKVRSESLSARSSDDDDDDDDENGEKRKKFLESNRAAANRCRQKKKQWINSLEEKTKHLQDINKSLVSETTQLRREIAQLKQDLLAHKDCPTVAIITSNI